MSANPNGPNWENEFAPPPPSPITDNPNGADWLDEFAPKTAPPTAPQTAPVTIPTPTPTGTTKMQTYEAILGYNNGLSMWAQGSDSYSVPLKGVVIHKIDQAQAEAISTRVKVAAPAQGLSPTYTLACLAIESTLDPNCQNGNLGPGESNTANDPMGYDMGIAQLKLKYIVAPGVTDHASALAFALSVDDAIPYHCSLMGQKVLWAQNVIQQYQAGVAANPPNSADPQPDERMQNPLMLATAAYNFGETGVMTYFENGSFPSHCQQVLDLERYFAEKLGVESIFPAISDAWPAG